MAEHTELLPCPFCGGPAHHITTYDRYEKDKSKLQRVVCSALWETPMRKCPDGLIGTKEEAAVAWNTRAPDPSHADLVAALERARKWMLEVPPAGTCGCIAEIKAIDAALTKAGER